MTLFWNCSSKPITFIYCRALNWTQYSAFGLTSAFLFPLVEHNEILCPGQSERQHTQLVYQPGFVLKENLLRMQ